MPPRLTRQEQSHKRNLDFSKWIRKSLPDSYEGFRVSDLDWVLANVNTKKIMLLEQKNYGGKCRKWQKELFGNIDRWISIGIRLNSPDWEYLGFHTVVFGNTSAENGEIWFDGSPITEEELTDILSF